MKMKFIGVMTPFRTSKCPPCKGVAHTSQLSQPDTPKIKKSTPAVAVVCAHVPLPERIFPWKTNEYPLKINGWKMYFLLK